MQTTNNLYEQDFYLWIQTTAQQLKENSSTITEQRICIEGLLEDSPSLKPLLSEVFEDCYQKARLKASDETGIKLNFFPKESPFSLKETLESSYVNE